MRSARPLLVLAAALLLLPAPARAWPARVLSVHDGDSFRVERLDAPKGARPVKIRVYGIDCPELEQPHGEAARALTARILTGKTVEITPAQEDKALQAYAQAVTLLRSDEVDDAAQVELFAALEEKIKAIQQGLIQ